MKHLLLAEELLANLDCLGHGPFSHMFDAQFIPEAKPGCGWKVIYSVFATIGHFTVVCSVTWPLNGSEAGVDLVLIQTLLLLLCKSSCSDAN